MPFTLFGADKISMADIDSIGHSIPNIILWAVPFMLFFTVVEMVVTYYQDHEFYEKKETIGSILVGLGNLAVTAVIKVGLLYFFIWLYNLLPWRMELNWYVT